MENRNYFDELIVSYLSGNLNAEEELFVLDWINSTDRNKQHFEELKKTWNLLSVKESVQEINVAAEWDRFEETLGTQHKESNTDYRAECNEFIENTAPGFKTKVYKFFVSTAVAA